MNFIILFHNKDKTCEHIKPEQLDLEKLNPQDFAWIDIDIKETETLKTLLNSFGLKPEVIREIIDPDSDFNFRHSQKFIVDTLQICRKTPKSIESAPLFIAMNNRLIITAHDGSSVYINRVLETYEESFKSVGKTPGFIYFLLWDSLIDGFLPFIFSIDEKLEKLEENYLHGNNPGNILDEIIGTKKMVRTLKQSISPMQRAMRHLVGSKLELISDEARMYLAGIFDHLDRLSNTIDSLQDRVHATLAGYNSLLSQQINNSMKILAIIATIMMPLSLLAGIYGTNFKYIPELEWKYGYFLFLAVLVVMAIFMLVLFRKKKWV